MSEQLPAHYHQLPRTTGTDTIYPIGLPLWDVNGKRIVVGDGVTPGGIPQAKQGDDTTYNRRFTSANMTVANRDWAICKAACYIVLPAPTTILQSVRVSALADNVRVMYNDEVLFTLKNGATIECVCDVSATWVVAEYNYVPDLGQFLTLESLSFNGDTSAIISFKQLTYAEYDDIVKFSTPVANAIYYITDTKQIFLNGVAYGADVFMFVSEFPQVGAEGKLYWNTETEELKCYTEAHGWLSTKVPTTTSINSTSSDYYLPTAKAVHDFVTVKIAEAVTPLDSLIIQFKDNNFEAQAGYFYICTVNDIRCTLPEGVEGDLIRFMSKGCSNISILPGAGIILDDSEGVLLDIENATITLYRSADGWSVIQY